MNTEDMTKEEIVAHYEHRIASERHSHADRLAAAEKAFALWRERLAGKPSIEGLSAGQLGALYNAIGEGVSVAQCESRRNLPALCIDCEAHASDVRFGKGNREMHKHDAHKCASAAIELLIRVTEEA